MPIWCRSSVRTSITTLRGQPAWTFMSHGHERHTSLGSLASFVTQGVKTWKAHKLQCASFITWLSVDSGVISVQINVEHYKNNQKHQSMIKEHKSIYTWSRHAFLPIKLRAKSKWAIIYETRTEPLWKSNAYHHMEWTTAKFLSVTELNSVCICICM